MDKEKLDFLTIKTKELLNIPFAYKGLKEIAEKWLNSVGTENENEYTLKYIDELEADIMSIDDAINFVESEKGIEILGADTAKMVAEHSKKRKASGEKLCGCEACTVANEILKQLRK